MSSSSSSSGIGFFGVPTIVLIVLKLLDKIDWSWWWVLAPVWASLAFAMICLLIAGLLIVIDEIRN